MSTRAPFDKKLKDQIARNQSIERIGSWAYEMSLKDIDDDFRALFLTLSTMEERPQFAFIYEELNKITDDLIAGNKVKL